MRHMNKNERSQQRPVKERPASGLDISPTLYTNWGRNNYNYHGGTVSSHSCCFSFLAEVKNECCRILTSELVKKLGWGGQLDATLRVAGVALVYIALNVDTGEIGHPRRLLGGKGLGRKKWGGGCRDRKPGVWHPLSSRAPVSKPRYLTAAAPQLLLTPKASTPSLSPLSTHEIFNGVFRPPLASHWFHSLIRHHLM